jgi:hypothetical protein
MNRQQIFLLFILTQEPDSIMMVITVLGMETVVKSVIASCEGILKVVSE